VVVLCLSGSAARAQEWRAPLDPSAGPLLFRDLDLWTATPDPASPLTRTPHLRLPRMPVTTLGDPLGLIDDADPPPDPDAPLSPSPPDPDAPRVQVSMGTDNPFFDFRRRGSPGGVGFYKLQGQFQFFDTGQTGCTLTCQAVRPAGLESNGVSEGPSFISPALTLFHDLGDGTALHGFVGKDVRANGTWRDGLTERVRYGLAVQQPVPGLTTDPDRGLFFFFEAQGCWSDRDQGTLHSWELVPGVHCRLGESWWLSGGLLVPVGPTRYGSPGHWHLACSWHF
jgi:hypothetical protein